MSLNEYLVSSPTVLTSPESIYNNSSNNVYPTNNYEKDESLIELESSVKEQVYYIQV